MTKHAFPAYDFFKQKRDMHRHLAKPRSIKLCSFIMSLQELKAYLEEFPPDIEGKETASLPAEEIMDIIYHSMRAARKNKMIEQGFNYADSTVRNDSFL